MTAPHRIESATLGQARQVEAFVPGAGDGVVVAVIGMAHDAGGRVVPNAFDPTRGFQRAVAHDHHAGMLGEADTDAAAM
jgi:hypothetical protein